MEWIVQRLLDLLLALLPYAFAFLVIYVFRRRIADVLIPRAQSVKVGTLPFSLRSAGHGFFATPSFMSTTSMQTDPCLQARLPSRTAWISYSICSWISLSVSTGLMLL
jgi:hypothetical protein